MSRVYFRDGSSVEIPDDVEDLPSPAARRQRVGRRRIDDGLSGRQRLERSVSKIVRGMWDFATGDGDDLERARRMVEDAKKGRG